MSENIMRIIDLRGQNLSRAELLAAMPRAAMGTSEATDLVRPILDDVKERGAAALRDFEEKFDHVRPKNLRVPVEAIKDALTTLDPEVRAAIEESSTPTSPKAPAWPNAGFRFSASACMCPAARPSTRAPSS
jgi:histidinol dehydrogenase